MRFFLSVLFLAVLAIGVYSVQTGNQQSGATIAGMEPAAGTVAVDPAAPAEMTEETAEAAPEGVPEGVPGAVEGSEGSLEVVPTPEGPIMRHAEDPTIQSETPDCGTHEGLIGRHIDEVDTENVGPQVKSVRVVRPGEAVTMEYMFGRLTIALDDDGVIIRASCG